jgi:hypothetical protein
MRTAKVIIGVGVLMLIGGVSAAVQSYDVNSQHDISKLAGSLAIAAVVIVVGVVKLRRAPA